MTRKNNTKIISVVHPVCCGLDVHKNMVSASIIISEPDKALASRGGLCPGNNESAGKRKSGKSPVRKHPFKELMIEIAWAAVRTKGSYYKDKYHRLKARRGPKRAAVAIAHRITTAIYHIISEAIERDINMIGQPGELTFHTCFIAKK